MNFKFGLLNILDSLLKAKILWCDIEIVATFISCVTTLNWALKAKRVSRQRIFYHARQAKTLKCRETFKIYHDTRLPSKG